MTNTLSTEASSTQSSGNPWGATVRRVPSLHGRVVVDASTASARHLEQPDSRGLSPVTGWGYPSRMAENKTQPSDLDVDAYLDTVDEPRRSQAK